MKLILMFLLVINLYSKEAKKSSQFKTKIKYKKETVVKFDEVQLDGAFQKPEGYYNLKAKKTKFDDLIEPKSDFLDELKSSVYTIDEE